ncbi:hypothetical protein J6590_059147 [Homalodisca vitripennis]|nr:hypothetical protein J6590_059147 [Homalodisca vitripennis]
MRVYLAKNGDFFSSLSRTTIYFSLSKKKFQVKVSGDNRVGSQAHKRTRSFITLPLLVESQTAELNCTHSFCSQRKTNKFGTYEILL